MNKGLLIGQPFVFFGFLSIVLPLPTLTLEKYEHNKNCAVFLRM